MSDSQTTAASNAPTEAEAYAAIRWMINNLDNLALQAYWSNNASYPDVIACLNEAWNCLEKYQQVEGHSCPFNDCGGGVCRPVCK